MAIQKKRKKTYSIPSNTAEAPTAAKKTRKTKTKKG
jgi:hypothetical protein